MYGHSVRLYVCVYIYIVICWFFNIPNMHLCPCSSHRERAHQTIRAKVILVRRLALILSPEASPMTQNKTMKRRERRRRRRIEPNR